MNSEHPQELHIGVAVRNDAPSRMALDWAIKEFSTPENIPNLLFTLIHVVSDVTNSRGRRIRVSEADHQSVVMHVCDNVLPFLETLQELCDYAQVTSSIEVVKNDLRPEAIVEASLKLNLGYLILGGTEQTTTWGTIAFCTALGKQPQGCTVISVINGVKVKEVSGTGELILSTPDFAPSSSLGVIESENEAGSTHSSFTITPNGSSSFGSGAGLLPLGPSPLPPRNPGRRDRWRNRNRGKAPKSDEPPPEPTPSPVLAAPHPIPPDDSYSAEVESMASGELAAEEVNADAEFRGSGPFWGVAEQEEIFSKLKAELLMQIPGLTGDDDSDSIPVAAVVEDGIPVIPEAGAFVRSKSTEEIILVGGLHKPADGAEPDPADIQHDGFPTVEESEKLTYSAESALDDTEAEREVDSDHTAFSSAETSLKRPKTAEESEALQKHEESEDVEKEEAGDLYAVTEKKEAPVKQSEAELEPAVEVSGKQDPPVIVTEDVSLEIAAKHDLLPFTEVKMSPMDKPQPASIEMPKIDDDTDGYSEPEVGRSLEVKPAENNEDEYPPAFSRVNSDMVGNSDSGSGLDAVGEDGMSTLERARLAFKSSSSKSHSQPGSSEMSGGGSSSFRPDKAFQSARSSKLSGALTAKLNLPFSMGGRAKMDRQAKFEAEAAVSKAIRESMGQAPAPTLQRLTDFRVYSAEELQAAMNYFSPVVVLGEGSYGIVYHGKMDGVDVAVKQLKSTEEAACREEIERELEVQRRCDHPNLVKLFGYSIENGCLVYEYLSNGSLEDRLLSIGGTPPLLWPERCRIAMETAAALHHLHTREPPIVHRDVKPANVLLDDHFVAKLGDVGLARLMSDMANGNTHIVRKSVIVGTEHYVDPEYLCARRGYLGPKSDVYSFGIVLLQTLVGGLPNLKKIDTAVEQENLGLLLDPRAGEWPIELAMDLANLGLWCSEMDRRDRPDLEHEVIPALIEICEVAAKQVVAAEEKKRKMELELIAKEEALKRALAESQRLKEEEARLAEMAAEREKERERERKAAQAAVQARGPGQQGVPSRQGSGKGAQGRAPVKKEAEPAGGCGCTLL